MKEARKPLLATLLWSARRRAEVAAILLAVTACTGASDPDDCIQTDVLEDGVVHITAARDLRTSAPIPEVRLSEFAVEGNLLPSLGDLLVAVPEVGITVRGPASDTLSCTPECAFGRRQGVYAFTATAPGYRPTRVQVDARFDRVVRGCPVRASGGTRAAITLEPL